VLLLMELLLLVRLLQQRLVCYRSPPPLPGLCWGLQRQRVLVQVLSSSTASSLCLDGCAGGERGGQHFRLQVNRQIRSDPGCMRV